VGRDGASEAAAFIKAGIPAVEFGPSGAGHHGPEEWVSLSGLARYRRALGDFVRSVPLALGERSAADAGPQAVRVEKFTPELNYSTRNRGGDA
jgi:succinyl-diaminopimelate desuccinylase